MHHSTWDLEVHVKEMQRRRLGEAMTARQVEAARCRAEGDHRVSRFSVPHFVSAILARLSPWQAAGEDPRHDIEAATAAREGLLPAAGGRANRLSQPYAGMVVLASGPGVRAAEQPCSVVDC